ncbi:hypothetical protein G9A89_012670 [Geosiphon pyriformis]|nr:hypothetical protein G9A89_012670 [Geosiphon pyriformis]
MMELQAIALALKSIPLLSSVKLFLDSQSALDVYKSELSLICSDFRNQCWVKHCHIVNIIHSKNLKVSWHKVKGHSGVSENKCTDVIANNASLSNWYLSLCLDEHFIMAGSNVVSGFALLAASCHSEVPVYLSVLCLYCDNVEKAVSGLSHFFLDILQLLSSCVFNSSLFMAFYKDFVFNDWFHKVVTVFQDPKVAGLEIVKFVHSLSLDFRYNVWSVHAKHYAFMEKNGLILLNSSVPISVSGLVSELLAGMVKLLDIADAFGVCFGFCKSCLFFSDVSDSVSVYIAA